MHDRHQTAQLVTTPHAQLLIDCGENTQEQLKRYRIRQSKIDHIFISHLHGDHYYGLPGLLNTYSLNNREKPLQLYAPPMLQEIINLMLKAADTKLNFELVFHPITNAAVLLELENLKVSCFPVSHRIPCWGFSFELTSQHHTQCLKYAYCADTKYDDSVLTHIEGANLLYHESTYLTDQHEKAVARYHSTSKDAARIAKQAGASRLLLGHFSSKYIDLQPFEEEAREVFADTEVSREGVTYLAQ